MNTPLPDPPVDPIIAATTWIQLHGLDEGVAFYPLAPKPEDIHLATIAHGLSQESRFASQTRGFWPVAMHCYVGSKQFIFCAGETPEEALEFCFHDASEALGLRDLPAPVKALPPMAWYRQLEAGVMVAVAERFDLAPRFWEKERIVEMDRRCRAEEQRDCLQRPPLGYEWGWWTERFAGAGHTSDVLSCAPKQAKRLWLARVAELFEATGRTKHALEAYRLLATELHAETAREVGVR